uniref:5'-3' DNA helicase ZGRF1 n=1 Tax=Gorilla gorilla gorilla TaxID=9595 RepID=G3S9F9_GORGO
MESQEFIVLYTHQKMKKSKVWQDGILKITHIGNKAILYDDKGACLESLFLKCLEVKPGDDLESDRYLITVEEVKVAGAIGIVKQNVNKEAPELNSRTFISSGRSLGCQPSGLKRKFTGFRGPRQVPKKMVIMESGESAASHEAKKTGPTIFSPFYSMPPLFPTVGKKDVNNILADPENIVTYKNRERNAMDFSSVFSPSFQINPEVLCEENYFCSPVNSGNKLSDSLLTNEPVKRDSLASHYSGVSQNIRSKAQILALLKSESSSSCEELNSEMTEHFPQKQPQGSLKIATKPKYLIQQEECAEMKSTENLYYQHQSENTMRNKSRWAMYLSSQSSPIHSSTVDGNDTERKPKAQEDNVNSNLKDLSLQKNIQFVETCAEERKKYNVDQSVGNNDPSWNQEVKLEIPSFNESSSLQVTCSSAENDGILSESDIQEDNKIPFNQNDKGCIKGSVLIKENAQEVNTCGTLEKEYEQSESSLPELKHLQIESSNNSRISDDITDMISESKMDNESLNSIHESLSNVTQPFLEVTFNLNNFETSDTEEESQESNKISQDSESWVKDILVNDGNSCFQKRSENTNCEETEGEHLPFLTSVSDKPTVIFPVKETLPSQFCDKTYVGFDMGICKTENTGKEIEEYSDTLSNFESFKWTDAVYGDNKEDANKPIQEVRINYDFALPPNKSKGINMNLHIPHIQNQIAENSNLFSEDAQPQPFILGSDLDKNDEPVLPSTSSSDNSVQLLNTNQNHYECITLDKSNTHISNSLFYPLGKKHLISKDTEAHISEPEDLGKIRSPPPDHAEVETAREGKQYWNPRNSSELSGLVNTISILKSLSEHSTALDSLEILKKKNTVFQQGTQQTYEPDSSPEVRKPFITVVSPKSPHLHKESQQFSSSGSKEETAFQAVIPKQIERKTCDPKPVEFQGHQVKGSATSGVMVRGHSSQLGCSQFPDSTEYENFMTETPELPSTCMQIDFLQVTSPEENISTLSPVSTFSLNSRDEDFVVEFSETSLKARTLPDDLHFLNLEGMKKSRSLEKENLQRLSLLSRTQVPLITLPRTDGPPDLDSHSYMINSNTYESSGSPMLNLCEKSAVLSFSIEPEDQNETFFSEESREVTPGDVSLNNISTQSKWLKYQNTSQCNVATPDRVDKRITDGFFAEAVSGMHFRDTSERQSDAVNESSLDSVHLQMIKGMLYQQRQDFSSQDLVSRKKVLSLNLKQTSKTEEIKNVLGGSTCYNYSVKDLQEISGSELCFPSGQKIKSAYLPQRQIHIPAVFQSPAHYKQTFTSCLIEHLNILLFGLAQNLQKALSKVDISFYTSLKGEKLKNAENNVPSCHHSQPAKLVMVKKEGPNKGRLFYTCDGPKADRCKFFKWLEDVTPGYSTQEGARPGMVLSDIKSIGLYLRSQKIPLYEECQLLVRKGFDFQRKQYGKLKKFTTVNPEFYNEPKTKLYLKLSRKESSSAYSKLHAGSENESEQLKELHALMKEDLTPTERVYVRKSIEQHKLGTNRTLLKQVRVVGATCAACPFPCMNDLKFPVVVLDECSQISEPASLLPIARFECEKLILVGDPKQLPPTIQGSDAAHENGLEQTLFDRLCLMGHKPILLRTQYRCHPAISAIANDLFYKGALMNGVTEIERSPLLEWLPTLCFYNVKGLEQIERDNSFHNVAEATFTLKLIQSLIASGIAGSMIGVITLYKSQMYKLCHLLSAVDFHHPDIKTVQVSTVDAFQGAEKEIIILSCVRTRHVGFIDSEKRMNVALTRGKRHLLIVGNLACLRKNRLWGRVIQHCEGREDGLQHANQYEPQLNHLLKDYFEKQVEEKQKKKSEKEKSKDKSHS